MATLLTLTSGSVTALVDRLERLGWASRDRHPEDRRKVIVTPTQKAWEIGQDISLYHEAVDATTTTLDKSDRAIVVGFLKHLIDNIAHGPRPANGGRSSAP